MSEEGTCAVQSQPCSAAAAAAGVAVAWHLCCCHGNNGGANWLMSPPWLQITILEWLIGPRWRILGRQGRTRYQPGQAAHTPTSPCPAHPWLPFSLASASPPPCPPADCLPLCCVDPSTLRAGTHRPRSPNPFPPPYAEAHGGCCCVGWEATAPCCLRGMQREGHLSPRYPTQGPGPLSWTLRSMAKGRRLCPDLKERHVGGDLGAAACHSHEEVQVTASKNCS